MAFHYNSSADGAEKAAAEAAELGVRALAVGGDLRRRGGRPPTSWNAPRTALGPIGVLVNNSAVTKRQRFLDSTPAGLGPADRRDRHRDAADHPRRGRADGRTQTRGDHQPDGRLRSGRRVGLLVTATARSSTIGLTKSLAKELARSASAPTPSRIALVRTDNFDAHAGTREVDETMQKILAQYPLRRLGRPEDIIPMVLLLASPLSSWTTGQVVSVNGGYAMP